MTLHTDPNPNAKAHTDRERTRLKIMLIAKRSADAKRAFDEKNGYVTAKPDS